MTNHIGDNILKSKLNVNEETETYNGNLLCHDLMARDSCFMHV